MMEHISIGEIGVEAGKVSFKPLKPFGFSLSDKKAIDGALMEICKVTPKSDGLVRLCQKDGRLYLMSGATVDTDEISMEISIPSEGGNGNVVVDSHDLKRIVKKIPKNKELSGRLGGNGLECEIGRSSFSLEKMIDIELPSAFFGDSSSVDGFLQVIDKVSYAMCQEDTRYYMCGVHLECVDGTLSWTATDGHRLAHVEQKSGGASHDPIVVPSALIKAARGLVKRYKDESVRYQLGVDSKNTRLRRVSFCGEHWRVSALEVDGSFPDYNCVLPSDESVSVSLVMNRQSLIEALDMASVCAPLGTGGTRFTYTQEDGLILSSKATGKSSFSHRMELDSEQGDGIEIGFNAKYLIEALKSIDSSEISMSFVNKLSPVKIEGFSDDMKEIHVVMPMRL